MAEIHYKKRIPQPKILDSGDFIILRDRHRDRYYALHVTDTNGVYNLATGDCVGSFEAGELLTAEDLMKSSDLLDRYELVEHIPKDKATVTISRKH